ncbi:MAG TPA: UvrD-helicase domain-containing protein [Patescibacteria group bacterium]|nr:UvrD-helicase domain-containing protein [Patescibacteria group bacterium]
MREGLNAEQRRALEVSRGPVLILAGAGSGKTKTLTHRIANLIANEGIWPQEILAVTFTNKAAREMRERLWSLLEPAKLAQGGTVPRSFMPWMGTFHGVCVRLLRLDGEKIGIRSNFVIYDEDDRLGLIKKSLKDLGLHNKQIKPRAISAAISGAKNQLITPVEYRETATFPFQKDVAAIYEQYETAKTQAGALDFDDLLLETVRLLRDDVTVREKWRTQFKHILIDEYQDTNAAQYAIVKYLVNDERNICVVGDDWQSIYSWRGADYTNILNFERDFPGTTVIKLEQNYRSTGAILDAAHQVITKNVERTDKKLWTDSGKGLPVEIHEVYDEAEEAYALASRIQAQVTIGARKYGDFAVLYRMNALSYILERSLLSMHIPYQIIGGVRFYDRAEIKDMIAYLRLVYQPADIMSFTRIVNVPKRSLGATSVEKFLAWQATTGMDIISSLVNADQTSSLTPRAKTALVRLGEILRTAQIKVQDNVSPSELIEWLLDTLQYRDYVLDGTPASEERIENLDSLISDARTFASVSDFLEEVSLMSSADTAATDEKVTLMTLHAAKGLEFPVVWMVGLEEGIFPHSRVFDAGPSELEEERRLCYVGMTRAREELHMSYASSRLQHGQRDYNMPSRFLSDMGHKAAAIPLGAVNRAPRSDVGEYFSVPDYDIGDRVKSLQFGTGEIVDIDGLAVSIKFENGQLKKLNVEYAHLEKLN